LPDLERREREATLISEFKSGALPAEEFDDRYAFRFPGEKKWLALVTDLMMAERECCPLLTFQLAAQPNRGALTIRTTGPEGSQEFLKSVLITP
jgi:hypothetical protein